MIKNRSRNEMRELRHRRIRKKIVGTNDKPRLSVFRSLKHIYVQIIDDETGNTLISASTLEKTVASDIKGKNASEAAKAIGTLIAERAKAKGIESVVFDRGGHVFLGRVKALADAAREAGLKF